MKVSELVIRLQDILERHGNVDVWVWTPFGIKPPQSPVYDEIREGRTMLDCWERPDKHELFKGVFFGTYKEEAVCED